MNSIKVLALGSLLVVACAPESQTAAPAPQSMLPSAPPAAVGGSPALLPVAQPARPSTPPASMASAPPPQTTPSAMPPASAPKPPAAAPAVPPVPASQPAAAGSPAHETTPPTAAGGGSAAESFCAKYEMHCGYAKPMRHADQAACVADFNANPIQQGCKNMHLDTAIAGTAAACNGMPSEFCFQIHCLHAAGLPDPTGTTYCK